MATVRRLPVTLLELLIVIGILALVSGAVAISINKALVDQRFRTEVSLIVDELRLAQDLMLILGTDVHVKFAVDKDKQGIDYWLELETLLPDNLQREIMRRKNQLRTIKGVFFEDELDDEVTEGQLNLQFFSNGAIMSKGIMRLATSDQDHPPEGTLENFICLAGYPRPIFSSDSEAMAEQFCFAEEEGFDERLTQDTVQRLPESVKQSDTAPPKKEEEQSEENGKPKLESK